jgi:hypothetical protein
MESHWKRSRVTKALTDAARVASFAEAEARLDAVNLVVALGADQLTTPAGQAAALTVIATAQKCFGRVVLVAPEDAPLIAPLPLGASVFKAARGLGARISARPRKAATHVIRIGTVPRSGGWDLRCWWDRWLSGTRVDDADALGDSRFALAGIFAGAVAVRQVFAGVLAGRVLRGRDVTLNLWAPWQAPAYAENGPERFDVPDKVWLLGLGHLGQAFVWNLCFLPGTGDRLAVLQDDQKIGEENEATSLLVRPSDIGKRKTRVSAPWLEMAGWRTELIERRHHGDIKLMEADPPILLSGVDRVEPRLTLARHGFPLMLDAGIGHGPVDFEGIQLRTIVGGRPANGLWCDTEATTGDDGTKRVLARPAYVDLEQQVGQCGTVGFAEASVAVPFVGAATGALTIAQAIRLASLEPAPIFMQMELGAPEMATLGALTAAPETNLGSFSIRL